MPNTRIDNLYQLLVENQKYAMMNWYESYKELTNQVDLIRTKLNNGNGLKEDVVYHGTIFENEDNSFDAFMYRFIKTEEEGGNGVSSNGQSVVSAALFDGPNTFKNDPGFISTVENLIKTPNSATYYEFKQSWNNQEGAKDNKVLINRTAAACNLDISSTVEEGKFNTLFHWLQQEGLIGNYTGNPVSWFEKNVFAVQQIDAGLSKNNGDKLWRNIFIWRLFEYIGNPFNLKKQIIKYGAPGTGKTYGAQIESKLQFEIWKTEYNITDYKYENHFEIVQFHPSFSYEDFIEGLRPALVDNESQLSLQNGIFKTFCIKAGKWESDMYKLDREGTFNYQTGTILDLETNPAFDGLRNTDEYSHWEYVFEQTNKSKRVVDALPPYFFIIDEINRAELSRVLGELMYSLEKRGTEGKIKTQYANLNTADNYMLQVGDPGENNFQFFIPNNVFVIGTMNTIDRSVESFDFALRRRFVWEEVMPNIRMLRGYLGERHPQWQELAESLNKLNQRIATEPFLGKDFQIGHAYLMDLPYSNHLTTKEVRQDVWSKSIKPLLEEYLRGTGKQLTDYKKAFGLH
ncbi:MAG: AAA family ATPase [Flavobacteriales bacterium]|nr:AAA family ATPase [Flavobacteriales bacterium]